jgi:hypothetical protein
MEAEQTSSHVPEVGSQAAQLRRAASVSSSLEVGSAFLSAASSAAGEAGTGLQLPKGFKASLKVSGEANLLGALLGKPLERIRREPRSAAAWEDPSDFWHTKDSLSAKSGLSLSLSGWDGALSVRVSKSQSAGHLEPLSASWSAKPPWVNRTLEGFGNLSTSFGCGLSFAEGSSKSKAARAANWPRIERVSGSAKLTSSAKKDPQIRWNMSKLDWKVSSSGTVTSEAQVAWKAGSDWFLAGTVDSTISSKKHLRVESFGIGSKAMWLHRLPIPKQTLNAWLVAEGKTPEKASQHRGAIEAAVSGEVSTSKFHAQSSLALLAPPFAMAAGVAMGSRFRWVSASAPAEAATRVPGMPGRVMASPLSTSAWLCCRCDLAPGHALSMLAEFPSETVGVVYRGEMTSLLRTAHKGYGLGFAALEPRGKGEPIVESAKVVRAMGQVPPRGNAHFDDPQKLWLANAPFKVSVTAGVRGRVRDGAFDRAVLSVALDSSARR